MLFDIAFLFYLLAFLHIMLYFLLGYKNVIKITNLFALLGSIMNLIFLIKIYIIDKNSSFNIAASFLSFSTFSLNLIYLILYMIYKRPLYYLFLSPLIIIFSIISILKLNSLGIASSNKDFWLYIHLPFIIFGTSLFLFSALSGIVYFIQEKQLKKKNFNFILNRFPPLETTNKINNFTLLSGFAFYTVGAITGFLWAYSKNSQLFSNPKIIFSILIWLIFGTLTFVKFIRGLSPKSGALWSIVGFIFLMIIYFIFVTKG